MKTPRINNTIKRVSLIVILLAAAVIASTAIARADGYLSPQEEYFADAISDDLCGYLDVAGVNEKSLTTIVYIIVDAAPYFDGGDAADIVNYVVDGYCPWHWDALVAFGEGYRAHA